MEHKNPRASFTLIELLVVIGIVAVLSVVVLITLNPAELLKQTRDSNRLAELDTLNRALNLVTFEFPNANFGAANVIYISLPDPALTGLAGQNPSQTTSTCLAAHPTLPAPPPGWKYQCAASSLLRKVDGTGWVPVDFTGLSFNPPFSALPVDPVNSAVASAYYSYIGGSWALTALLESQKYLKQSALNDSGTDPARLEVGTNLNLTTQASGLIGYWKLDETAGTVATDSSGNGYNGTLNNSPLWVAGKIGGGLQFSAASQQYVSIAPPLLAMDALATGGPPYSIEAWVKITSFGALNEGIVDRGTRALNGYGLNVANFGGAKFAFGTHGVGQQLSATTPTVGIWYHLVGVYEGVSTGKFYLNGVREGSGTFSTTATLIPTNDLNFYLGRVYFTTCAGTGNYCYLNGTLDEVKLYNRALTAAEVSAIYNATK